MPERPSPPRYARVLYETTHHPKFIGDPDLGTVPLQAASRGTWSVAHVLGAIAFPNPVHEAAVRLLCPGARFDELYERELLDPLDDRPGWFHVHDLADFHRAPSEEPEATRDRKRRQRARAAAAERGMSVLEPVTPVTDVTPVTPDERNERDSLNRVNSPLSARASGQRRRPSRPFENDR